MKELGYSYPMPGEVLATVVDDVGFSNKEEGKAVAKAGLYLQLRLAAVAEGLRQRRRKYITLPHDPDAIAICWYADTRS